MGWNIQDVVRGGQYIQGEVTGGVNFDLFGSITAEEIQARVSQYASGWTVSTVQWDRGVIAGLGSTLRVFGRADSDIAAPVVQSQIEEALNSFAFVFGAAVAVSASDNLSIPTNPSAADSWQTTIRLLAAAAIVLGIGWVILQTRKAIQ